MRTSLIITTVILQVALLAFMAGQREYIAQTGKIVYLRTEPVDPMDPFRGEYVRLNYEIADSMTDSMRQLLKKQNKDDKRNVRVYTVLDVDENQVAHARYITDKKPSGELFIRGRAELPGWRPTINYGIEAYFVEQGQGQEIEKLRGVGNDIMVSLEMKAAIGANGVAVLKGYRFDRLGINATPQRNELGVTTAKLTLKNVSDAPLAIVDLPGGKSLSLEHNIWGMIGSPDWQWVNKGSITPEVQNSDIHILQPQEEYEFTIDFSDPMWYVNKDNNEPYPVYDLNKDGNWGWSSNFRLIYTPPSKQQCEHLENAALIWHGQLRSQTFNTSRARD